MATRAERRASRLAAAATATWIVAHLLGVLGPLDQLTFVLLATGTVIAVVVGVRRWHPEPRWPWIVDVAALCLFLLGGVLREAHGTLGDLSSQRSLAPEPFSIAGYVALGFALYGVARSRLGRRWRDPDATLDALVVGVAPLALAWIYVIAPVLRQQDVSPAVRVALALYPALSAFLVVLGARLAFTPGQRPPLALRLVIVSLGAVFVGDVVYMLSELGLVDAPRRLVDSPYAIAYALVIVAVLHPSLRDISTPIATTEASPRRGLVLVSAAACVPLVVLLAQPEGTTGDRVVLAVLVVVLLGLAGLRVFRALSAHARSEARLAHLALHDPLTGLPNRVHLHEHLDLLLERPSSDEVAVLLCDLDRFRLVNDTLGHDVGDELLKAVAARLADNVRSEELIARIGGDEFVVVLPRVRDAEEAAGIAERLRLTFGPPFDVAGASITVSTSVGIALARPGGRGAGADALLRDADTAMYAAKDVGGDDVSVFDATMRRRTARRLALEGELRGALERDELRLAVQPVVQVGDGRVSGFEALLRWDHPRYGTIAPGDFIPVAEETGQIVEIGAWVIDEAARLLSRLRSEHPHGDALTISVNVSVRQLRDERLCDHVARSLVAHDLPRGALCLELTESMLAQNLAAVGSTLATLQSFGVRTAIDDFGTGYSSLAYLRQLPVDVVKLDQQFVSRLGQGGADDAMVAAMVALAGSLGIDAVAEGVETPEQAERLETLGCRLAQGFLWSRPVAPAELPSVLGDLGLAGAPHLRVVGEPG